MFKILKLFYWSVRKRQGRFALLAYFLGGLPSEYGIEIRRRFYRKYLGSMGDNVTIRPDVMIVNPHKLHVGDHSHIGVGNMIQAGGGIEIGNHVVLGPDVKIWSINHKFKDLHTPVMEQGYEYKKVVIGNHCWIGSDVFIMPGANIGEGVVVSAGAVVGGKPIPPYKIVAGNPARVIGTRTESTEPQADRPDASLSTDSPEANTES
ncbi:MAG: acyltransferase [Candidatus Zixiibacteriota bacterium]|nr:MAG: acyltransferase [candidate division Zixibacteria bacterium]